MVKATPVSDEMACALERVRVVLLSPLYGGNVGSICRAMANMGLVDLAIAAPRPLNQDEARMMACHATGILESRTEYATVQEAVADCGIVVGTTARTGLYRQHVKTPREWAPTILEAAASGPVAFLFGPEDNGLSNDDLAICTHLVQIPTTVMYSSLNLSQAVIICLYELFLATEIYEAPEEKAPPAESALRERMFGLWREVLLQVGFMSEDTADHMMLGIRRILARGAWSSDDVNILMGMARQAAWAANQGARPADE